MHNIRESREIDLFLKTKIIASPPTLLSSEVSVHFQQEK